MGALTVELRAVLAVTPKFGLTIFAQKNGQATSYRGAADMVMTVRKRIGSGAESYDLHALRHTAAAELAALRLADEMIQAITGHSSPAMVAHYSAATRQKACAKTVQAIREQTGGKS